MRALLLLAALLPLAGCLDGGAEPLAEGVTDDGISVDLRLNGGWPATGDAIIRPGVTIHTPARDCPSNFLFMRPDNGTLFIGTTAYCVADLPVGTVATIGDDTHLAVLAYSSWHTMAENGEQDAAALEYNDFAVFYIDSSARRDAHPAILDAPGPTALADGSALAVGDRVLARAPPALPLQSAWRDFTITGQEGDWALLAHALPPTLPGGMGGAVLTPSGEAVGIVVNLGLTPNPGANAIARLDTMMAYARQHANLDMVLATWDGGEKSAP